MSKDAVPEGAVPLSEALASLRGELTRARWDGRNAKMRFKPAPIELTLKTAVTRPTDGPGKASWSLLDLGTSPSSASAPKQPSEHERHRYRWGGPSRSVLLFTGTPTMGSGHNSTIADSSGPTWTRSKGND